MSKVGPYLGPVVGGLGGRCVAGRGFLPYPQTLSATPGSPFAGVSGMLWIISRARASLHLR